MEAASLRPPRDPRARLRGLDSSRDADLRGVGDPTSNGRARPLLEAASLRPRWRTGRVLKWRAPLRRRRLRVATPPGARCPNASRDKCTGEGVRCASPRRRRSDALHPWTLRVPVGGGLAEAATGPSVPPRGSGFFTRRRSPRGRRPHLQRKVSSPVGGGLAEAAVENGTGAEMEGAAPSAPVARGDPSRRKVSQRIEGQMYRRRSAVRVPAASTERRPPSVVPAGACWRRPR
jgi:hypothetical protein